MIPCSPLLGCTDICCLPETIDEKVCIMGTEEKRGVPQHVAIILDGNGRWAKSHGLARSQGHKKGADNVDVICQAASDMGIKYLTVYAFSTENWKRSEEEVSYLMTLMRWYLDNYVTKARKNGIRIRIIGDREGLDPKLAELMDKDEAATADMTKINLTFAINYGGRDEITRAVKKISKMTEKGEIKPEDVSQDMIASLLDTKDLPDPDLMIRTSGELRTSNFLLWQLAYSEFYFTDKYWPEFTPEDLRDAVEAYRNRDRRFGGRNTNKS